MCHCILSKYVEIEGCGKLFVAWKETSMKESFFNNRLNLNPHKTLIFKTSLQEEKRNFSY